MCNLGISKHLSNTEHLIARHFSTPEYTRCILLLYINNKYQNQRKHLLGWN